MHEYVHVWQSAFKVHPHETRCSDEENKLCELGNGPLWLEEGSAEYFAVYFAEAVSCYYYFILYILLMKAIELKT